MKTNLLCFILTLAIVCSVMEIQAQNQNSKWYFGYMAGLDFSTNPPTVITTGNLNTDEGCATICDAAGNLQFYTDGRIVYTTQNDTMANGSTLTGDFSSTQSAAIVKQPGNNNIYCIFTTNGAGTNTFNGFRYSTVDMSLAAGLGSVTVLNTPLFEPSTEKIAVTRHCNGTDAWVVSHDDTTANFRAFLVTSAGVNNNTPVISAVGTINYSYQTEVIGTMKISQNGKKLVVAVFSNTVGFGGDIEVYDFDNSTGVVSNSLSLGNNFNGPYAVEFSPDGTKLYATLDEQTFANMPILSGGIPILQWDLCAGNSNAVSASLYTIATTPGLLIGDLQVGLNGKIYVAETKAITFLAPGIHPFGGTHALGVINNPNVAGAGCNYVTQAQSVGTASCTYGLQNVMASYFYQPAPPAAFTFNANCLNGSFAAPPSALCTAVSYSIENVLWTFGDPASGTANTSTLSNATHLFSTAGTYSVQLVKYYKCHSDTIAKVIIISECTSIASLSNYTVGTTVYPNPGNGKYTFTSERDIEGGSLSILNATGQEVLRRPYKGRENSIDISFLDRGLYYYCLISEGHMVSSGKLYVDK